MGQRGGRLGGRRCLVGALVGLVGVVLAALVWVPRAHHPGTAVGRSGSAAGPGRAGAGRTLDRLARAVLTRDRDAYLATMDPSTPAWRAVQGRVFDDRRRVPFRDYRYTVRSVDPPDARTGAVTAHVDLAYRLTADPKATHRDLDVTFLRTGGHPWLIRNITRVAGTPPDPWDVGPVTVVNGPRALVLGVGSPRPPAAYARLATVAARRVDTVWGTRWPRRAVVVVPSGQDQLVRLLGRRDGAGLDQVAASTTGASLSATGSTAGQPQRIIVNPAAMAQLTGLGRQVTLTHEMVHVATRYTATASPPLWLAEGFADQMAYAGTGLSARAIAGGAVDRRRASALTGLPADSRFDPRTADVDPAYVEAWAAADEIARRWGRGRLTALYRAVADPGPSRVGLSTTARTDAAFRQVLGTSVAGFVPAWRSRLERIAG